MSTKTVPTREADAVPDLEEGQVWAAIAYDLDACKQLECLETADSDAVLKRGRELEEKYWGNDRVKVGILGSFSSEGLRRAFPLYYDERPYGWERWHIPFRRSPHVYDHHQPDVYYTQKKAEVGLTKAEEKILSVAIEDARKERAAETREVAAH